MQDRAFVRRALDAVAPFERTGRVVWAFGGLIKATGLDVRVGQSCVLVDRSGRTVPAEVVGFADQATLLSPLGPLQGVSVSVEVVPGPDHSVIACGPGLLGRVISGLGAPLDGLGAIPGPFTSRDIYAQAPGPLERDPIDQVFPTGVRAMDTLLTVGFGQRIGVFATAGGGKSTLMGMLGRHGAGDVNVIALIGERGREVREFLVHSLGAQGLARSVIVASTSDRPAIERVRAANVATAIAEGFRAEGKRVVLMMDSVTRYARALREIGLAAGEPTVRRGFTPSVFAELPRLFERAGAVGGGSITAFYTVLLEESEEGADPIGEEVRSILDGHVYLSRRVAEAGRYPAIDVSGSISRLFHLLADEDHRAAARQVRAWIAKYAEIELLLQIGEYKPGSDEAADRAIERMPHIERFLSQPSEVLAGQPDSLRELMELAT